MDKYKNKRGFTILEMSIVLAILSTIVGSILTIATSGIEEEKREITEKRMIFIIKALKRYATERDHIPCPADPTLAIDNAQFGVGQGTDNDPGAAAAPLNVCTISGDVFNIDPNVTDLVVGTVPTSTLAIQPIYMLDGWRRKITYIVDEQLTFSGADDPDPTPRGYLDTTSSGGSPDTPTTMGDIQVNDGGSPPEDVVGQAPWGTDPSDPTHVEPAAVIIISHGRNGHGAWNAKGVRPSNTSPNDQERENIPHTVAGGAEQRDNNFIMMPKRERASGGDHYFDDIVMFQTKWQLEQEGD